MGNKKNIDNIFKHQFKNFEAIPPDSVWENISNELDKEDGNEKRILPLWMKLGGIAASLLFLITVGVSQFSSEVKQEVIVSETDLKINTPDANITKMKQQLQDQLPLENNEVIVESSNKAAPIQGSVLLVISPSSNNINADEKLTSTYEKVNRSQVNLNATTVENHAKPHNRAELLNAEAKTFDNTSVVTVDNNRRITGVDVQFNTSIVSEAGNQSESLNKIANGDNSFERELSVNDALNEANLGNALAGNLNQDDGLSFLGTTSQKNKDQEVSMIDEQLVNIDGISLMDKNSSVENDKQFDLVTNQNRNTENSLTDNELDNMTILEKNLNNSMTEVFSELSNSGVIDETSIVVLKGKDSVDIGNVSVTNSDDYKNSVTELNSEDELEETIVDEELPVEQTIEEAIAEQEFKKEEETDDDDVEGSYKKWKVAPNVAPVYYNSLTSGSPIDGDFKDNKKKGQFTTSYGIGVGYAVSKRISVRTGINRLEVGYDTQDVAVYSSPETSDEPRYKNINLSSAGSSMSIAGSGTYSSSQIPSAFSSLFDSSLNQRFGYLEVPLELSYKLSDKKLRVDIIAGMSTFFLNKNEIYSENKVKTTYIGEANNLNDMSYSTNLGIGLEYKISKNLNFNFDPTFKYQLNAFSNDSGNFRPYILGIYSGLSYRF